jgi:predicted extracellular nuclease
LELHKSGSASLTADLHRNVEGYGYRFNDETSRLDFITTPSFLRNSKQDKEIPFFNFLL